ncbi:MG2 domain-containing protein [Comamonas humi]
MSQQWRSGRGTIIAGAVALAALQAQATSIARVTPQGEVAQVRQVVVRFDGDAVRFGDLSRPAPVKVSCDDKAVMQHSTSRWTSSREWVFDFFQDLPPGVNCTVAKDAGFKDLAGQALQGAASYAFNTGGPFVASVRPGSYEDIDEDQFFGLRFNGAVVPASVEKNSWCVVDGVGERMPVRLLTEQERLSVFEKRELDAQPGRYVALTCSRPLPSGARMKLVIGKGVTTPSGMAGKTEKRVEFNVRPAFTAEFNCERENAQAACLPIRPMTLNFNAPVARKLAEGIRLGSTKPFFEEDDKSEEVSTITFKPPFPEKASYRIELPSGLKDVSGRSLSNAAMFPLKVGTGEMPPLAKFAAAPFGVVERFAEGEKGPAIMPVTLRKVEPQLQVSGLALADNGSVSSLQLQTDADIIRWWRKVNDYHETRVERKQAARDVKGPLPRVLDDSDKEWVASRQLSLLGGQPGVKTLDLPKPDGKDPRPFEVVGIPLTTGFHVLEIASPMLGEALLNEQYGAKRTMYVRSSALVTNLGVHFKLGRENSMAWVTTLDKGKPVAGAQVRVSGCDGTTLMQAVTDKDGVARFDGLSPEGGNRCNYNRAYFVSARATVNGAPDMAFVWTDWQRGIESWRFNLDHSMSASPDYVAHTVLDRSLLRAGETVSMKHFVRAQTREGLGNVKDADLPDEVTVTHLGSSDEYSLPVKWQRQANGSFSGVSEFKIPPAAKLGTYQIVLKGLGERSGRQATSDFRVEEFRLPVFTGRVAAASPAPLVQPKDLAASVQLSYVSGGAAANLPVQVSAMVQSKYLEFADYSDYSFAPPQRRGGGSAEDEAPEVATGNDRRIVADKLALTLDGNGSGKVALGELPASPAAQDLVIEANFSDPNGEVQTLSSRSTLWPAAVVAGIKAESWASAGKKLSYQALALSTDGKPAAGVPLEVRAVARITTSVRKRMVGGFYSYDNQQETKDLGVVCSGKTDARGLLLCESQFKQDGEVQLIAQVKDDKGRMAQAATSVWVTKQGELWFGGQDHDRMDLLPEKKSYKAGETARFQVRMPFRHATALLTVEREGIIAARVVDVEGSDPTVSLKIEDGWGPNVYVSVLALRGRLVEVPWYSFFTWGYKSPREWWTSFWYDGKEYVAPTALVDLSKPAYRLGVAEIRVGIQERQLAVSVKADQDSYQVRGKAKVRIEAKLPDGKPAAGAQVALAAVDQALLELRPNTTWNLLEAMYQKRAWGVENSTAQMEIIGRRHYGRKAVAAGGGGGLGQTRELLDTLLLWRPNVQLDANGQAEVEVPLNDALTSFKIVAVADSGLSLFGTGSTSIRTTQDLQIISGLPPLVREGDQFEAQLTLRNTTSKAMRVKVSLSSAQLPTELSTVNLFSPVEVGAKTVEIPAGESQLVSWPVTAPQSLIAARSGEVLWTLSAKDENSGASDALKVSQRIVPAVPVTVRQATLVQLDGSYELPVEIPATAQPGRGGIAMSLMPKLAEGLPGVRDWWGRYPYACLEQQFSKAIGLGDGAMWKGLMERLPTYLDDDGLAYYFPPSGGRRSNGSDTLTAYLLTAGAEMRKLDPAYAVPAESLERMSAGLAKFVQGKIERKFWSPRPDLDVRKIAAIHALAHYGKATPAMLSSITLAPNQWPTHAVIDWLSILKLMKDVEGRAQRLEEASQILRGRLSYQGTKLIFSTEKDDYWWWLMQSGDVNTARLMLTVMEDPAWKEDMPRLANGFIARQQSGAWHTTTANLWGAIALQRFSRVFESVPVTGTTQASLAGKTAEVDWSKVVKKAEQPDQPKPHTRTFTGAPTAASNWLNNTMLLPWPTGPGSLKVQQSGTGKPWLTVQSLAAVPLAAPVAAGYQIKKTVTPVEQASKGQYTRGDVLRVTLEVNASADMTWVAITDPVPTGATILGGGLGRDSAIATEARGGGEKREGWGWPAFEERSFEAYRSYYEYLPKGTVKMEYTVRLNSVGEFSLPPSRVEALYAPEMFGELPNAKVKVQAAK